VRQLGSQTLASSQPARALHRATPLRKGPSPSAPVLEPAFPRGHWCRVLSEADGYSEVAYEELDHHATPPRVLARFSGWVESDAIADAVERHFFHLECLAQTPERWVKEAEARFECYWTALAPRPQLHAPQQGWLDAVYEALVERL
jgi:hypothetical protein